MATLCSGVLLKLLDGMKTGAAKPIGEHRTALLQVTDIVPADLDDKDLLPRHGNFYVKLSDSSHSIYATLPLAQADLVLSNKLQLGQFLHLDRLDPGSPVPVLVGARPLPGRHPLVVGTPDPASRAKPAAPRRGSWGPENHAVGILASPKVIKPTTLNFDDRTPVKERPPAAAPSPARSTVSSVRKSSSVLPRMTRSKSFVTDRDHPKIPKSPFPTEKSSVSCYTASRAMSRRAPKEEEPSSPSSDDELCSSATSSKKRPSTSARVPVPGKLNLLAKEAMEQREQAQKAALEALRNASATENVVRIYKMFAELSKTARPDAPATCFESFLSFHQEAVQAVTDIEAVQAATSMAGAVAADEPPVLQEIAQNRSSLSKRRGGLAVSKSVSFAPGTLDGGGGKNRSSNASRKCLVLDKIGEDGGDEKRSSSGSTATGALGASLRLAKQMQSEAGSWFMEFVEAALETGLKKKSKASATADGRKQSSCCCPQSLILRVINWVEMEQSGDGSSSRKTGGHPRAAAIARKLRIKAKNP
ncbi:hypothetical protein E2562_012656 [Oryza meyeriana var. granulata]|uniref:DUF936 family protein n=1 Tax=Oryza meyeriana var. granulata TaxID=110450 RepID=A0A6G1CEP6_9ORYZ|nr:hypothetical protein E2562_012656 [Oryza meyeriana var. granulata]